MHDDLHRLNKYFQSRPDYYLPDPPEGLRWSEQIWISELDEWIALFRPLNLGVCYFQVEQFKKENTRKFPWQKLLKERFIQPVDTDIDQHDHDKLRLQARSGTFRFICILPTTSCTMRCAYCHQRPASGREETMTQEEIETGLNKCAVFCTDVSKPVDILIYGGEPLNAFHITQTIIQKTRKDSQLFEQPVRLSFTTSGYGLTLDQAEVLADADSFVILSVDGPPEVNDFVRINLGTESSFVTVIKAIQLLKRAGCRIGLSVTIGKHNVANLKNVVTDLIGYFDVNDIGLNAFLHWKDNRPNAYQVDVEDAFTSYIDAFEVTRQAGVFAEQPFRRIRPFVHRNPLLKDCSAPAERLVLAPGGLMGFCDSCFPNRQYFYFQDNFPGPQELDYELWASLSSPEMPECSSCPAMTVCGGACRYDAFKASGRLDGVDPQRCRFERAFLNWMLEDLWKKRELGEQTCYFPQDEERYRLLGSVKLTPDVQPFIAGSYSP